mgnify:CR=1 FL=1
MPIENAIRKFYDDELLYVGRLDNEKLMVAVLMLAKQYDGFIEKGQSLEKQIADLKRDLDKFKLKGQSE